MIDDFVLMINAVKYLIKPIIWVILSFLTIVHLFTAEAQMTQSNMNLFFFLRIVSLSTANFFKKHSSPTVGTTKHEHICKDRTLFCPYWIPA